MGHTRGADLVESENDPEEGSAEAEQLELPAEEEGSLALAAGDKEGSGRSGGRTSQSQKTTAFRTAKRQNVVWRKEEGNKGEDLEAERGGAQSGTTPVWQAWEQVGLRCAASVNTQT